MIIKTSKYVKCSTSAYTLNAIIKFHFCIEPKIQVKWKCIEDVTWNNWIMSFAGKVNWMFRNYCDNFLSCTETKSPIKDLKLLSILLQIWTFRFIEMWRQLICIMYFAIFHSSFAGCETLRCHPMLKISQQWNNGIPLKAKLFTKYILCCSGFFFVGSLHSVLFTGYCKLYNTTKQGWRKQTQKR